MSKKDKIAIFLFSDQKYIFCIGNILLQLKRFDFIDKFIIYLDVKDFDIAKKILEKIDMRVEVHGNSISKLTPYITDRVKKSDFVKHYTLVPFTRIFAVDHLKNYENVLILDSDIFIKDKFSDIIFELPKADLTWRHAGEFKKYFPDSLSKILYPSGALINVNKSIYGTREEIKKLYFDFVNNNIDNVPHVDELGFAYFADKINAKINYLTRYFNTFIYYPDTQESQVICAVGNHKFWSHPICALLYPEWIEKTREFNEICSLNGGEQFIKDDMATDINESELFKFYDSWQEVKQELKLIKLTDISSIDIIKIYILRNILDTYNLLHTFKKKEKIFGGIFNFLKFSNSIQVEFYKEGSLYHIDLIENNVNNKRFFSEIFKINYFVLKEENNILCLNYNTRNFYKFIYYFKILAKKLFEEIDNYESSKKSSME